MIRNLILLQVDSQSAHSSILIHHTYTFISCLLHIPCKVQITLKQFHVEYNHTNNLFPSPAPPPHLKKKIPKIFVYAAIQIYKVFIVIYHAKKTLLTSMVMNIPANSYKKVLRLPRDLRERHWITNVILVYCSITSHDLLVRHLALRRSILLLLSGGGFFLKIMKSKLKISS